MVNKFKNLEALRKASINKKNIYEENIKSLLIGKKIVFEHQKIISPFIVDFYFKDKGLVLEIDGISHNKKDRQWKDCSRDEYLIRIGLSVVRFHNSNSAQDIVKKILSFNNIDTDRQNKFIAAINRAYNRNDFIINLKEVDFSKFKNTNYLEKFFKLERRSIKKKVLNKEQIARMDMNPALTNLVPPDHKISNKSSSPITHTRWIYRNKFNPI